MQGKHIDDIIAANTGLIFKQLHKFSLVTDPEAESVGYEALYNAILTFDESKQIAFSTYATVCIYNALGCYVRSLNKVRQLEVISYNNIYTDDDEHEFLELLSDGSDLEDEYIKGEQHLVIKRAIKEVYCSLTNEKHKAVLKEWYLSDYTATTAAIAKKVDVSQPYTSQVLSNIKHNLKKRLEDYFNV